MVNASEPAGGTPPKSRRNPKSKTPPASVSLSGSGPVSPKAATRPASKRQAVKKAPVKKPAAKRLPAKKAGRKAPGQVSGRGSRARKPGPTEVKVMKLVEQFAAAAVHAARLVDAGGNAPTSSWVPELRDSLEQLGFVFAGPVESRVAAHVEALRTEYPIDTYGEAFAATALRLAKLIDEAEPTPTISSWIAQLRGTLKDLGLAPVGRPPGGEAGDDDDAEPPDPDAWLDRLSAEVRDSAQP